MSADIYLNEFFRAAAADTMIPFLCQHESSVEFVSERLIELFESIFRGKFGDTLEKANEEYLLLREDVNRMIKMIDRKKKNNESKIKHYLYLNNKILDEKGKIDEKLSRMENINSSIEEKHTKRIDEISHGVRSLKKELERVKKSIERTNMYQGNTFNQYRSIITSEFECVVDSQIAFLKDHEFQESQKVKAQLLQTKICAKELENSFNSFLSAINYKQNNFLKQSIKQHFEESIDQKLFDETGIHVKDIDTLSQDMNSRIESIQQSYNEQIKQARIREIENIERIKVLTNKISIINSSFEEPLINRKSKRSVPGFMSSFLNDIE